MSSKTKSKSGHGGKREGAGRKPASALRCPVCEVLKEQLQQAHEREQKLIKQLGELSRQIGTVIDNKFETVRIKSSDIPKAEGPVFPVDQLTDVNATDDESFVNQISELTQ